MYLPAVPQKETTLRTQSHPRVGSVCHGAHSSRRDGHRVRGSERQTGKITAANGSFGLPLLWHLHVQAWVFTRSLSVHPHRSTIHYHSIHLKHLSLSFSLSFVKSSLAFFVFKVTVNKQKMQYFFIVFVAPECHRSISFPHMISIVLRKFSTD